MTKKKPKLILNKGKKIEKIKIGFNELLDEETINKMMSCGGKDVELAEKINEIVDALNDLNKGTITFKIKKLPKNMAMTGGK